MRECEPELTFIGTPNLKKYTCALNAADYSSNSAHRKTKQVEAVDSSASATRQSTKAEKCLADFPLTE